MTPEQGDGLRGGKVSAAFYLQTPDGRYIYPVSGTWGPQFMTGTLDDAYAFENDEYAKEAVRCWGGPLKRVPVPWTRIKPLKCDTCHKRRAVWGHPLEGVRCDQCHKSETA